MEERFILPFLAIAALFALCAVVRVCEGEIKHGGFRNDFRRLFRQSLVVIVLVAIFVIKLIGMGGPKPESGSAASPPQSEFVIDLTPAFGTGTGSAPGGGTALPSEGLDASLEEGGGAAMSLPENGPPCLSADQFAAGFALVRVLTNSAAWYAEPPEAATHGPWTCYGLHEDTFWLPATNWAFLLGTNAVDGAHVSSDGTLSFGWPKGSAIAWPMPDGDTLSYLAPLQGSLGTVPPTGRFWHAPTPSNSVLMTWRDLYAGRDAASPVTFQAELFWNGDFVYRYAFTNAVALTNLAVGAQHNGGGETYAFDDAGRLANGLELRWRAFGVLDPETGDHDGDGVSTYDEVMTCGTDPRLSDTDFDGLSDGVETDELSPTSATNPDSDRDGLADSADPLPAEWGDPAATNGLDNLTYWYKVQHGLDPAADNSLDSDGDNWPDWQELLAGTSTNDYSSTPWNGDGSYKLFDATITLGADLPCPVVLTVGGHTLVLQKAGSWTLTLKEGVAHGLVLTAAQPCDVSLSVSMPSAFAALQDASGAFSGGTRLPGGVPVAGGLIAQPTLAVMPGEPARVCFHSDAPKTVAAKVSPPMAGSFQWYWYGGDISSATGRSANISWDGGYSYIEAGFTAAGATQARYAYREVTRCSRADDDTWCDDHACEHWYCACDAAGALDGDDCGFHGRKVSECKEEICPVPAHNCPYSECPDGWCHRHDTLYSDCGEWWCHMHERYLAGCGHEWYEPGHDHEEEEGGGGSEEDPDPGEPVFGSCDEALAAANNDDDDASGAEDSGEDPVGGENDLVAVWPLGYYDGQCCTCPEHLIPPDGSESAELESFPEQRLALYQDACKSNAFGTVVDAGEAVWVQGLSPSTAVGADRIVWKWTDGDNNVRRVTNAFTVLSVRLFGDIDLDGDSDADDKALHPGLSHETGWCLPAATNVYRPVRLRTDVGLSGGAYTLSLSGTNGAFRVWPDASGTNAAPLLVGGQTVTNGAGGVYFLNSEESDLYVEAVSNGTATLTYAYTGTGDAAAISCAAAMKMTGYRAAVSIASPDSSEWGDLLERKVILSDKDVRLKISITPALSSLERALDLFGTSLTVMTSETCPSGQELALTGQNATLVQMNGSSEIRVALNRTQLVSLGLLPVDDQDSVYEKAWMDYGIDDPLMPSNLNDGMVFNSDLPAVSRGRCTGVGNLNSSTTNSPMDKSFFVAAGREIITAEFGGAACQRRQLMNQADIFYFSGHGDHSDGTLEGIGVSDVGNYWQQDLDVVVFSACSVLDINDYNDHCSGSDHTASPGKLWEQTGPQFLLGYNYVAPSDLQGTDTVISYWIANRTLLDDVVAWRNANDNSSGRNACAIEKGAGYYYFQRTGIFPFYQYTWTYVPKASW